MAVPSKIGSSWKSSSLSWIFLAAVALLLLALLGPAVSRARESGRRVGCLSRVRSISCAMALYAEDNKDQLPYHSNDIVHLLTILKNGHYLQPGLIYACPSESPPRVGNPLTPSNISYGVVVYGPSSKTKRPHLGGWSPDSVNRGSGPSEWPLVVERGIEGAGPSQPVTKLIGHGWSAKSPHGIDGGSVSYIGGWIVFKKGAAFEPNLLQNPTITNTVVLLPE